MEKERRRGCKASHGRKSHIDRCKEHIVRSARTTAVACIGETAGYAAPDFSHRRSRSQRKLLRNDSMTPEEIGLVEMTCEAILEGDDPELEEMDDPTRIPPGRGI